MASGRRKEITRHLTEAELDAELGAADDPAMVRRIGFVKNLYRGDTLAEAAAREGKSQPTGVRWAERWNEDGLEGLAPDYGDGRPPKLNAGERRELHALLDDERPSSVDEVRRLVEAEFDVTYHQNYVYELLASLGEE